LAGIRINISTLPEEALDTGGTAGCLRKKLEKWRNQLFEKYKTDFPGPAAEIANIINNKTVITGNLENFMLYIPDDKEKIATTEGIR